MILHTIIGLGGGTALATIAIIVFKRTSSTDKAGILILGLIAGLTVSVILCSKKGTLDFANNIIGKTLISILTMAFTGFGSGFWVLAILGVIFGIVLLVPLIVYMVISYCLNIIYYGLMALLESVKLINPDSKYCLFLDKLINLIAAAFAVFICIYLYKKVK